MKMIEIMISENEQNKRLDHFVRQYLNQASLSYIYKLFRKKEIKINKKPAKPDYITKLGDVLTIYVQEQLHLSKDVLVSKNQTFKVIYEDQNVLIVNKPIHLLVHEGNQKNEDNLTKQVLYYLIQNKEYVLEKETTFVPALAHRLDRNTSGLVVFGKNALTLQSLFLAFKEHDCLQKKYLALVAGIIKEQGEIELPLKKDEQEKRVYVSKDGAYAKTLYQPIRQYEDCTLLEVTILTGRTHQIRVHLQAIGHPLIGDQKYGNSFSDSLAKKYKMKDYFLHAKQLRFIHIDSPLSYLNKKSFVAPLFLWQEKLLQQLSKGGNENECL